MLHRSTRHQKITKIKRSTRTKPSLVAKSSKGKQQEEHSPLALLRSRSRGGTDRLHGESRHRRSDEDTIWGRSEADGELGMR